MQDKQGGSTTTGTSGKGIADVKAAESQKEKEPQLKAIGEELQVGDVIFKVNKVSTTNEIKDGQFLSYKPDSDGSVFYIVNVTVKNAGNEMINTDSSFFQLKKGEVTYAPTTLFTTSKEFFLFEGINPGLAKTGNVAFEVPKDTKDFVLNVQTGFFGTEQGQFKLK
ncbi:DUF4352 domain-containing protein [Paenibacillus sp. SC116]|uniref:DUF4352 domain-containing protein n=1 Tax=Paenibacillus sp. SC116 TaxID=2968986 RepID=UPI00215B2754|nr:DUF4352 domain-containing protein [Paenibacillus sp. SC116]